MATRSLEVTRAIRTGILEGSYPAGHHMNEIELAEALGVSRTPIRGALATLAAEGLLEYTPNSGYTVRRYGASDILDIYTVRSTLVGLAARLAAEIGLSDAARGAMHRVLDATAALVETGLWNDRIRSAWEPLNAEFHGIILDAAENPFLADMIRRSAEMPLFDHIRCQWYGPGELQRCHDDHTDLAEAIFSRQGARAEALSAEHTLRMGRHLARHWRKVEVRAPARDVQSLAPANDDGSPKVA